MPKWLTQEWHDETKRLAADQPARPGATTRMQYVLTGGPAGEHRYYWVLEEGRLLEATVGSLDDPELTLTMSYADAKKIQQGDLDAQAAFMQGRVKADGRMEKLMALLPITSSPEYMVLQDKIREVTEYD
jgi:putative sterol carrier protein